MKAAYITGLILPTLLFLFGCNKGESVQQAITGSLLSHSSCKRITKSTFAGVDLSGKGYSSVVYSYNKTKQVLSITHINAGFNCCPDSLYCNVSIVRDSILIKESEAASLCCCNCLYDLEIGVNGLPPEEYVIRFIEPYIGGQKELIINVDLSKVQYGRVDMPRDRYPWGD